METNRLKYLLHKCYDSYWHKMIYNDINDYNKDSGNKLRTYRTFKKCISYEKYLNLKNFEKRKNITQLRISAHKLKIETGRFNSKINYIPPEQRFCTNCSMNITEDERHFILHCPLYSDLRKELFLKCSSMNTLFTTYSPNNKFIWILSSENMEHLNVLGGFIINALKVRKD